MAAAGKAERGKMSHAFDWSELGVRSAVQWLRLGVETLGALIVGLGVLLAAGLFLRAMLAQQTAGFNAIRLTLARYLALALEFQLGADILSTAVAPSWEEIGKMGAIAVTGEVWRTGKRSTLSPRTLGFASGSYQAHVMSCGDA